MGKKKKKLHRENKEKASRFIPYHRFRLASTYKHRKSRIPLKLRCAPAVRDLPERGPNPRSGRIGTG